MGDKSTILLDRNKMLKDLQDAMKEAGEQFKTTKDQGEQVYLTGMLHSMEDMVAVIASGAYNTEEAKDAE